MKPNRVAVLIHGCHLETDGWERVMWGAPEAGILGRIPKGLEVAHAEDAALIYWGTGASERDGLKESQYYFNYAVSHGAALPRFEGYDVFEIESVLRAQSIIDIASQSTAEEILGAACACATRDINKLILVSSPTHIARCIMEAEKLRSRGLLKGVEVLATSSNTCFSDSGPEDVVVVEPPHRGDRPPHHIHKDVRRIFSIDPALLPSFGAELAALVDKYGVSATS